MSGPDSMRAWQVTGHGEPSDVLRLGEVPVPAVGPDDVLIRVRTVAINFADVLLARGEYQERPDLPFIPGVELCGDVAATGANVTGLVAGQRVVAAHLGVLAEYAVVPAVAVHDAPAELDDAQAAALTVAYQTAWFALHRRAGLAADDHLLVHAAAGGVGTAAVQVGAAAGATVIGVVGHPEKVPVAKDAGAAHVLVRGDDGLAARVRDLTGRSGADVVFDPVGGDAFEQSVRCIAFEGRIVVVGFAGGRLPEIRANHLLVKNYSVHGLYWALYQTRRPDLVDAAHGELTRLAAEGAVRPMIGGVVDFENAPEVIDELGGGASVGRLVVRVGA